MSEHFNRRAVLALSTLCALLGACAESLAPDAMPAGAGTYIECTEPRPQMCTQHYDPVCAQRDTGIRCVTTPCDSSEWRRYGNACEACADTQVYGYRPGDCETGHSKATR